MKWPAVADAQGGQCGGGLYMQCFHDCFGFESVHLWGNGVGDGVSIDPGGTLLISGSAR